RPPFPRRSVSASVSTRGAERLPSPSNEGVGRRERRAPRAERRPQRAERRAKVQGPRAASSMNGCDIAGGGFAVHRFCGPCAPWTAHTEPPWTDSRRSAKAVHSEASARAGRPGHGRSDRRGTKALHSAAARTKDTEPRNAPPTDRDETKGQLTPVQATMARTSERRR